MGDNYGEYPKKIRLTAYDESKILSMDSRELTWTFSKKSYHFNSKNNSSILFQLENDTFTLDLHLIDSIDSSDLNRFIFHLSDQDVVLIELFE
jgi:hypothetical protein